MNNKVSIKSIESYDSNLIYKALPNTIFNIIKPEDSVVLKPNWVRESHINRSNEWKYVITHPTIITAVLKKVLERLNKNGRITITDGPESGASFEKTISHYPIELWKELCRKKQVFLEIIDLRDDKWIHDGEVIVKRLKQKRNPLGKTEVNLLGGYSEFYGHKKSKKGYYGADYDIKETNNAHDGHNNLYRVSRIVLESDIFINLPKLKTHKKAGITCCLKNLVGINTYKNYLPHYTLGYPSHGGDQYPEKNFKSNFEGLVLPFVKQNFLKNPSVAKMLSPIKKIIRKLFYITDNDKLIRNGDWYGNDTLWRTVVDLNKVLFYSNADGKLKKDKFEGAKKYIGIVDGIMAGEGNGPMQPDPVDMGYIIIGTNPVSIDTVSARLMGFDPFKIPAIYNSFNVKNYKICDFNYENIKLEIEDITYKLGNIPKKYIKKLIPPYGWKNHIEIEL